MILYWDRFIIADKMVDFNIPDIVHIDRDSKTIFVIDITVLFTHNLPKIEADKIMKYENLALEIKTMWKLS
jgi:hypothetical protein